PDDGLHALVYLESLSEDDYRDGPAVLLTSEARFVYVVDGAAVLWVVEWPPGIVAVRFTPDGGYAAARLSIEDDDHPMADLLAAPWSAQFDPDDRADAGFAAATEATRAAWDGAMAHVQRLGESLSERLSDEDAVDAWRQTAQSSRWVRET
ncbi:MAG: hypothetical protein AAF211_25700, partial [Myxococcota bacterium]